MMAVPQCTRSASALVSSTPSIFAAVTSGHPECAALSCNASDCFGLHCAPVLSIAEKCQRQQEPGPAMNALTSINNTWIFSATILLYLCCFTV
jgi:hypothetical protein